MLYIVLSNFLCWFPVIIMGMLALAGVNIPGAAYSWTAVLILPLNSATDPVVYTLVYFIQNFMVTHRADRQMLASAGIGNIGNSSSRDGGSRFRMSSHSATHAFNKSTKLLRGMSKDMSNELSNHLLAVAESNVTINNISNSNVDHNQQQKGSNHHLTHRSDSYVRSQSAALLLRPPLGYRTLSDFMRNERHISPRDILEICQSISTNLKEFHDMGFALGAITFENIFVIKQPIAVSKIQEPKYQELMIEQNKEVEEQIEYRLQTYIPGFGFAYKVCENDEDPEDYAVNVDEFGIVVKRMLQLFHARQIRSSHQQIQSSPAPPQASNNNNNQ